MSRIAKGWLRGCLDSLAIGAGYFPVAVSFGVASMQAGLSPDAAILTSLILYAGAAQFVLVTLLAAGGGAVPVILTILLINARHLFYGPPIMARLTDIRRRTPLPILAFGLTDEVFAASVSRLAAIVPEQREGWYLGLATGAYAAWVGGTVLGVSLGRDLPVDWAWLRSSMGFILPALFVTLLLEMGLRVHWRPVAGAALATAVLMPVLPGHLALVAGMVCGAAVGLAEKTA